MELTNRSVGGIIFGSPPRNHRNFRQTKRAEQSHSNNKLGTIPKYNKNTQNAIRTKLCKKKKYGCPSSHQNQKREEVYKIPQHLNTQNGWQTTQTLSATPTKKSEQKKNFKAENDASRKTKETWTQKTEPMSIGNKALDRNKRDQD